MGTNITVVLSLFIDFGNVNFSHKYMCDPLGHRHLKILLKSHKHVCDPLIFMSTSNNTHCPYVCDPLGLYISQVNDFANPITLIGLPYQLNISTYTLTDKELILPNWHIELLA